MASHLEVRRLNIWIQSLSTKMLLECSSDELAHAFANICNKKLEELDEKVDKKPEIVLGKTYRDESRMPSSEGFWTPPRSSKSSEGESTGYRSTP